MNGNDNHLMFRNLEYILVVFITTYHFLRTTEPRWNFYNGKRNTDKLPSAVGISTFGRHV